MSLHHFIFNSGHIFEFIQPELELDFELEFRVGSAIEFEFRVGSAIEFEFEFRQNNRVRPNSSSSSHPCKRPKQKQRQRERERGREKEEGGNRKGQDPARRLLIAALIGDGRSRRKCIHSSSLPSCFFAVERLHHQ